MYEVNALLKGLHYKYQSSWEQTRFLSYVIAQVNSTKRLDGPADIMTFPWEEKEAEEPKVITDNDVDRLKEKMQQFIKDKTSCQQI